MQLIYVLWVCLTRQKKHSTTVPKCMLTKEPTVYVGRWHHYSKHFQHLNFESWDQRSSFPVLFRYLETIWSFVQSLHHKLLEEWSNQTWREICKCDNYPEFLNILFPSGQYEVVTSDAKCAVNWLLEWSIHHYPIKLWDRDQLSELHGWLQSKLICSFGSWE